MDRLNHYRHCLQEFLRRYSSYGPNNSGIETQVIADTTNDHYLLLRTGWDNQKRVHHCIFHFDIKDGKIWLQVNNTDIEVDQELADIGGITRAELVVGFHHPSMREDSEFATAS